MAAVAHGVRKLGVLGAGQMGEHYMAEKHRRDCANELQPNTGLGIAYVAALRAKVPVLLHDRSSAQIQKGLALMDKLLEKDVAKACRLGDFAFEGVTHPYGIVG